MAVDPKTAAQVLGKIGRDRNTKLQAEASRINGRKGGRPKLKRSGSQLKYPKRKSA